MYAAGLIIYKSFLLKVLFIILFVIFLNGVE